MHPLDQENPQNNELSNHKILKHFLLLKIRYKFINNILKLYLKTKFTNKETKKE